MNSLTDVQIKEIALKNGLKIDIHSRDQIPRTKSEKWNILNLDKHTGEGTHWTAYKNGTNQIYFDSFGIIPPEELAEIFDDDYIFNTTQIQDVKSSACGWYCLAFIRFMCQPISPKEEAKQYKKFVSMFNENPCFNDHILNKLISQV